MEKDRGRLRGQTGPRRGPNGGRRWPNGSGTGWCSSCGARAGKREAETCGAAASSDGLAHEAWTASGGSGETLGDPSNGGSGLTKGQELGTARTKAGGGEDGATTSGHGGI
ncbi:keratin, type II cytoskeletal 2 epidermal-like [Eucalyptus grandis]|uniref:keratin, type II cytoskeletal 2 epidermal-like n=1 Tax=Eucalyptus grandis TaxID=71139 RepID=UPI0008A0B267|nr:keratin, type II cytoskeletal 2 epidermal-like [Eucalyptus grandis]